MVPFPWRVHSDKELEKDFLNLRNRLETDKPSLTLQRPLVGYKCSNAFFQKERMRIRSQNKPSAIDYWKRNHEYVKKYESNNDLFGRVVFLSFAPSEFNAYAAGMIYKYFMTLLNKTKFTVQDFYSGWSNRLVAAMALNVDYIGCDSNTRLQKPYEKMIDFFSNYSNSKVKMYFQPSETLRSIPAKGVDMVFSSPPFFNNGLVEEYPETESDYETFMRVSLVPIMKKCLDAKIWVCLYIPSNMYKDLKKIFGASTKKFVFKSKTNNLNAIPSNSNTIYCWK